MNTANTTPRPEYPRPQFTRADWMNLNGVWEFEIDASLSGEERDLHLGQPLSRKITVPFCPESELSGIGEKDFMPSVWYRRAIELPAGWNTPGKRVFLHFGACDYETTVWVNGSKVGFHRGGYTSFAFEITRAVVSGSNIIVVRANDDTRSKLQPTGKQSERLHSYSCLYTRTTGIWQTVWLEAVPDDVYITQVKFTRRCTKGAVMVQARLDGHTDALQVLRARMLAKGEVDGRGDIAASRLVTYYGQLAEVHLWEPGRALPVRPRAGAQASTT